MPNVRPIGSAGMKAVAEAKEAGKRAVLSRETMRRRINSLQIMSGYRSRSAFAAALGMEERRIAYIIDHPESCKFSEAVTIQTLARQFGHRVFDFDMTTRT